MAELVNVPKSQLTQKDLQDLEEYEFNNGPMKILTDAVSANSSILVSLRNNHKLIGKVKAFDRHCNLILENVKEIWFDKNPDGSADKLMRERFVSKMFLRGDSVIIILKHSG